MKQWKILLFNFFINRIFWMGKISSKHTNTTCKLLLPLMTKLTFFYWHQKVLTAHYSSSNRNNVQCAAGVFIILQLCKVIISDNNVKIKQSWKSLDTFKDTTVIRKINIYIYSTYTLIYKRLIGIQKFRVSCLLHHVFKKKLVCYCCFLGISFPKFYLPF